MGDNFLKKQIENFEKSTDSAMDAFERAGLIRRSDVFAKAYKAKPLDGVTFEPGETLYAVATRFGVRLGRGHRHVGEIPGQGAAELGESLKTVGSVVKVRVVNVSDVSRRARIEVIPE